MDEEELAILHALIDWVKEIMPDLTCEISNGALQIKSGKLTLVAITITENGLCIDGEEISWTRSDIQREFQRLVLVNTSRQNPHLMVSNKKFFDAWTHIMTQDVSRGN